MGYQYNNVTSNWYNAIFIDTGEENNFHKDNFKIDNGVIGISWISLVSQLNWILLRR